MTIIALFESTRAVIKSERLCKINNISCKVIPVPRHLSSGCGMALEMNDNDAEQVALILKNEAIDAHFEEI